MTCTAHCCILSPTGRLPLRPTGRHLQAHQQHNRCAPLFPFHSVLTASAHQKSVQGQAVQERGPSLCAQRTRDSTEA